MPSPVGRLNGVQNASRCPQLQLGFLFKEGCVWQSSRRCRHLLEVSRGQKRIKSLWLEPLLSLFVFGLHPLDGKEIDGWTLENDRGVLVVAVRDTWCATWVRLELWLLLLFDVRPR